MTPRQRGALGIGGGIIAPIALAITAATLWAPSAHWGEQLWSAVMSWAPTALLGALALVIGVGVLAALGRTPSAMSPGTVVGIGLACAALITALCHQAGVIGLALPLLVAASGTAIAVRVVIEVRRHKGIGVVARGALKAITRASVGVDLVILVVIGAFSVTVARFGLTSWTDFVNDFQRYASSAEVWLADSSGSSGFENRHPDAFGSGALLRASYEKPMANALLVWSTQVTDLAASRLLTPVVILLLWVTVSAVAQALRSRFGIGAALSVLVALPPSLSVIPVSRLLDAQLGQLLANATLATALAVAARPPDREGRKELAIGAVVGALLAAAIGMNSTLVLSLVPLIGMLLLWLRARVSWRFVLMTGAAIVAFSIPFATDYLRSARDQTSGEAGFDIEFPSVLSIIGLQPSIDVAESWTLVGWLLVLAPVTLVLVVRSRTDREARWAVMCLAVAAVSCVALIVLFGADNYGTHKWLASAIPLAVPFLIASAVVAAPAPIVRRTAAILAFVIAAASFLIATNLAYGVSHVVPVSLHALEDAPELEDIGIVNIDLDDPYLDSIAPLVVPTDVVIATGRTYAAGSPPRGDYFLVQTEAAQTEAAGRELASGFLLVERDLSRGPGTLLFEGSDPEASDLLYGAWAPISEFGTPADRGGSIIAFDPAGALVGNDVRVTIYGSSIVTGANARSGTVAVNGVEVAGLPAANVASSVVSFDVPWDVIADNDGRLAVTVTILGPRVGYPDDGAMSYTLAQITLESLAGGS